MNHYSSSDQPIVILIATNMEYDAFLRVAYDKADTVKEIKKTHLKSTSFDSSVEKNFPFDKACELIIGNQRVIAIHTSESIRRAARAVDYAIWYHNPKFIINFGTAGALKSEIGSTGIFLAKSIVQYDFDISGGLSAKDAKKLGQPYIAPGQHEAYDSPFIETNEELRNLLKAYRPDIKEVVVASGNKFVFGEEKERIVSNFGADIADMEAAGILLTCNEENTPSLIIKCISDGVDDTASDYYENASGVSEACSAFVMDFIRGL